MALQALPQSGFVTSQQEAAVGEGAYLVSSLFIFHLTHHPLPLCSELDKLDFPSFQGWSRGQRTYLTPVEVAEFGHWAGIYGRLPHGASL